VILGAVSVFVWWQLQQANHAKARHDEARLQLKVALSCAIDDPTSALHHASLSAGIHASYEAWYIVGLLLSNIGSFNLASSAFHEAKHIADDWNNRGRTSRPDLSAHAREREAVTYARECNWEFAWLRSADALDLVSARKLPAEVDGKSIEFRLRLIRLIAAINSPDETNRKYVLDDVDEILAAGIEQRADSDWRFEGERACMCVLKIDDPEERRAAATSAWDRLDCEERARESGKTLRWEIDRMSESLASARSTMGRRC
jgi:hypothetical protein